MSQLCQHDDHAKIIITITDGGTGRKMMGGEIKRIWSVKTTAMTPQPEFWLGTISTAQTANKATRLF